MDKDCMAGKLIDILWRRGIISTQDHENLFFGDFARDLSRPKYRKYKKFLEDYLDKNKIEGK